MAYCYVAHLHTWKEAQLLLALLFSIGTDDAVLPDHNRWRGDGHHIPVCDTPLKIATRSLVSALEMKWFLDKSAATIAELDVCHIASRNAAINASELYRLKQFIVNRAVKPPRKCGLYPILKDSEITIGHFYYSGVKFYYMTLLACFQRLYGLSGSGKDTEMSESFHKKVVKEPLECISNNTSARQLECARYLQKQAHAECMSHKEALTSASMGIDTEGETKGEAVAVEDDRFECLFIKKFNAKNFKKVELLCGDGVFSSGKDPEFNGFPYLHAAISLECLHGAMSIYLAELEQKQKGSSGCEFVALHKAMSPLTRTLKTPPIVNQQRFFLTEGVKLHSFFRCGDLKETNGDFFIRSTQAYLDDRRGPLSLRTTHALNSFCFVSIEGGNVRLVRVLAILTLGSSDGKTTEAHLPSQIYCLVVLMSKCSKGFLPYDRFRYSFVENETKSYADVQVVNARDITSPAFVVSTNPAQFRHVDDFTNRKPSFYCISTFRVQCIATSYEDLTVLNTSRCQAFQSVDIMNEKNNRLDADVQDFNRRVMEKRRTGTSAILKPTDKELEKTKKMACA